MRRPVLVMSFGDAAFEINSRTPSPFDVAANRVVSQTFAFGLGRRRRLAALLAR